MTFRPNTRFRVAALFVLFGLGWAQIPPAHIRLERDGAAPDEFQGVAVSDVGDVNADGYPDVAAGASGEATFGPFAGAVRVYSGRDGALLATVHGTHPFDEFGYALSAAGDLNLDGFDDVLVGAIGESQNGTSSGSCRVLSGEWVTATAGSQTPLTSQFLLVAHGDSAGDNFGLVVSEAGDIDRDGFGDIAVGAPRTDVTGTNAGSIRVISGLTGSVLATFDGEAAGDQLGHACAAAGDVNADGWPDIIGGAFLSDAGAFNAGMARVYSGEWIAKTALGSPPLTPQVLATFTGDSPFERFGLWVTPGGDVNADGYADAIVGSPSDDHNGISSGSVYVFSGEWITKTSQALTPLTTQILYRFDGEAPGDFLGTSCAGGMDVDADGFADIAGGAPSNDQGGLGAGAVYIWSGATGQLLHTFYGDAPGAAFGIHVSRAGDINRDGFHEVIAGAPFRNNNFINSGTAYVLSVGAGATYRENASAANTLSLAFVRGPGPSAHDGLVEISGAEPLAPGILILSFDDADLPLGLDLTLLVDLGPAYFDFIPFFFSGTGDFSFNVDLKDPGLAGVAFYLQAAQIAPTILGSNGLLLLFVN